MWESEGYVRPGIAGQTLRVYDATGAKYAEVSHDGANAILGVSGGGVVLAGLVVGNRYYVNTTGGNNVNDGLSWAKAKLTITGALAVAVAKDIIYVAPGSYDEEVSVARAKSNLTIVGAGNRGSVFIAPSGSNKTALTIEPDDFTLINVGCEGDGTGGGVVNRGKRTRIFASKIEGGTTALTLTLGTAAQIAALTHGKGDDLWIVDSEICWSTNGVKLVATDYGAVTQVRFRECTFHDNTAADFEESGGSVDIRYRDLDIGNCYFQRQEDGTEPTAYILLNDNNGNKGVVHGCFFPTALAGGKNLVSTGLIWVGNFHTGGISTTQPS